MNKFFKILGLMLLIAYTGFASVCFYNKPKQEICKEVEVNIVDANEVHFINSVDVERMMKDAELIPSGEKMGDVNTEEIEVCLKKNRLIRAVQCFKTNDHKIKITVEQRIPVLRVMSFFGNYYIDKEGKAMPVSSNYSARLAIASGFIEKEFAECELYKFALFLRNDPFWGAQIQQIDVQQNHEIVLSTTVGNQKILLGQIMGFETKLANLFAFYNQGCNQFGWNKYKTINLRYEGQIICSPN